MEVHGGFPYVSRKFKRPKRRQKSCGVLLIYLSSTQTRIAVTWKAVELTEFEQRDLARDGILELLQQLRVLRVPRLVGRRQESALVVQDAALHRRVQDA